MYSNRKLLSVFLTLAMVLSMVAFGGLAVFAEDQSGSQPEAKAEEGTYDALGIQPEDFVIFYTNDVHGGVNDKAFYTGTDKSLGYAALAALKAKANAKTKGALLVDSGDSIQGSVPNTMSSGKSSMLLMKETGYDYLVPGNHEFDFSVDKFIENAKGVGLNYICANFTDMNGNLVFNKAYDIADVNIGGETKKIAFIGLDTPESISKGTPKYFQDKSGNYIYTFNGDPAAKLYEVTQVNIDKAKAEGADFVIVLGHIGDAGGTPGWYSGDVIANTSGIDVFLDGHAHNVIPGKTVKDKSGKDVLLTSTGTKLNNIGVLRLSLKDGKVLPTTALVNKVTDEEKNSAEYKRVNQVVKDELAKYGYLEKKIGKTDFPLVVNDPSTGKRLVRNANTNMADFITDSYLWYAENDPAGKGFVKADAAIMNGGSIRADINSGDINYLSVLSVLPWNTRICEIEATGQMIVDALEMGAKNYPDESGGFISGGNLTYEINKSVKSNVALDDKKMFVKVNGDYYKGGYRVQNVRIGGKPVDLNKKYNLVITAYYYKNTGDGMTMFKDAKAIVDADKDVLDIDIFNAYLSVGQSGVVSSKYSNPYGEGRIKFTDKAYDYSGDKVENINKSLTGEGTKDVPDSNVGNKNNHGNDKNGVSTGDAGVYKLWAILLTIAVISMGATVVIKKNTQR